MLNIIKVNAGIAVDGSAEFSLSVLDDGNNVYEVQLDNVAYTQLLGVIEESVKAPIDETDRSAEETFESSVVEVTTRDKINSMSPEKREALIQALSGTPQHAIAQDNLNSKPVDMSNVGFDLDYSASFEDEYEEDPGEELEDSYAEPL